MNDITYWIWYAIRCGVASTDGVKLLEQFHGNVTAIYETAPDKLLATENIDKAFLNRLTDRNLQKATEIKEICSAKHIRILSPEDEDYPKRLLSLTNYPMVLYAKGNIVSLSDKPCVAVVGSRNMTAYGKDAAFDIVRGLCGYGIVIVSGAAYGIDTMANQTAVYFGGDTVAVLGSGIDVPYPPSNQPLLEQIAEHGLVISEYMPGTPPIGRNFPIRNRIISGLADAVLIVEASDKSGSLITAKFAVQQNRYVFAVPGNIYDSNSRGTNGLIRQGAKICTCTDDILRVLSDDFSLFQVKAIVTDEKYIRYEMRMKKRLFTEAEAVHNGKKTVQVTHTAVNGEKTAVPKPNPALQVNTPSVTASDETAVSPKNTSANTVVRHTPDSSELPKHIGSIRKVKTPDSDSAEQTAVSDESDAALTADMRSFLNTMPHNVSVAPDQLVTAELSASEIISFLTVLELSGKVESLPGGLYRRIR